MSSDPGALALGRYRLREVREGTSEHSVLDAVDPRRPGLRVRLVVVSGPAAAEAARIIEQTRRYALGTPALSTAACFGETALPGSEGPRLVFVFELGAGRTLDELPTSSADLDLLRALRVIENAARALTVLHDQGIGHGFVTPALIAIDANERVTLGGYGVAQLAGAAEPRADAAALRTLARELLRTADNAEIARRLEDSEDPPADIVRWADELASAVREETAKATREAPAPASPTPPPLGEPAPFVASEGSHTPPAVVVTPRPPLAAAPAPPPAKPTELGS